MSRGPVRERFVSAGPVSAGSSGVSGRLSWGARCAWRTRRGRALPLALVILVTCADADEATSRAAGMAISVSGISTIAVVPPYGEPRSSTAMPCRAASRPVTCRPSRSVTAASNSGGRDSLSLIASRSCGVRPAPRSSTSTAMPLAASSARTDTSPRENTVAFSTSSASRWMTSAAALPLTATSGRGNTCTLV